MRIAIEKDFRCLTRPREQDEPDAYPHPAENRRILESGGRPCLS
jgi:hypothetical protein